jgi:parallel beta-helix repeat protein
MWNRRRIPELLLLGAMLLTATVTVAAPFAGELKGQVLWQGEVVLKGTVTVVPTAVLTIAPGTTVRASSVEAQLAVQGILIAAGNAQQPIVFAAPPGWRGIDFSEARAGSRFAFVRFDGAQTAISTISTSFAVSNSTFRNCGTAIKLVREASPRIEDCLFDANEIGIDNEMKSAPQIRRNRFVGHKNSAILVSHNSTGPIERNTFEKNKQGIGVLQKYADRIVGNRFVGNEVGVFCNQTQSTPRMTENVFEGNKIGLVNFSFSYPLVENSTFSANDTGVRNDQYGSPKLAHNVFRGNKTAIYNYRKSNPEIENNLLENNDLALYCDYSSYPLIKNNNFLGNKMGVELGIFQSADWEKRSGSKGFIQETAAARNSQNPLIAKIPTTFNDYVDVSGNWWGVDTPQLVAGKGKNIKIFFDRKDKPTVVYEGFGPDSYVLDEVRYTPWLTAPVKDVGPVKSR